MQINPNASATGVDKTPGRLPVKARAETRMDSVLLNQAEAVNGALQQTPEVRSDVMELATGLANNLQYPPLQVINAIGRLLALQADSQNQQE